MFGFIVTHFSPDQYDELMLRGFSRSGTYLYLPLNEKTCCPQHVIKLDVSRFTPSRSQRKMQRKFKNILQTPSSVPSSGEGPRLSISMERASFSQEKFDLYRRYTVAVHNDDFEKVTEATFTNFLVTSPLNNYLAKYEDDIHDRDRFGTFHQCYRLNDAHNTLIAVGVLDLLPSGLISVYFYYDVTHKDMSLGRLSAVYEIAYAKEHDFESYYMGYYVHNCSKMNYKRDYAPSYLLCPATQTWAEISTCLPLLDQNPHYKLTDATSIAIASASVVSEGTANHESATTAVVEASYDLADGDDEDDFDFTETILLDHMPVALSDSSSITLRQLVDLVPISLYDQVYARLENHLKHLGTDIAIQFTYIV